MSSVILYLASFAIISSINQVGLVIAQTTKKFPDVPLANKRFSSPDKLPFKVDTDLGLERGQQFGFNICNSTTEGPQSNCQTAYLNSPDDFCLWSAPEPNSEVFDKEGEMVAWCSKPGRGTRVFPEGTITGLQFMRTPDYVQVVGFIDQSKINLIRGHFGGEMDPHGADLRGNPMGGIVFSNAWSGSKDQYKQAVEWHNFMGGDQFCFKICDPSKPNDAKFCEHRFDRIGCEFNAPHKAQPGQFVSCLGDNQDFPGTYTGADGQLTTYTQPPEELGPITTQPYSARIPASSSCVTYQSAQLFAGPISMGGQGTAVPGSSASTPTPSSSSSAISSAPTVSPTQSTVPTTTPANTTPTASPSATQSGSNNAGTIVISGAASFLGVVFAALFLS